MMATFCTPTGGCDDGQLGFMGDCFEPCDDPGDGDPSCSLADGSSGYCEEVDDHGFFCVPAGDGGKV